jgi:tRNA-uridine 2-sulfurtransferase
VRVLQEQSIEILAVTFITPFFGSRRAEEASRQLNVPLRIIDISEDHLRMLKCPPHGYGRTMNPCIDCHTMMLNRAGRLMEAEGYDFLFTGEVLGERPMSQNIQSLRVVAESSGYPDFIVRPLSAQLLADTKVEREGLVDRSRLLALEGRSRKPQMELARCFGIVNYPTPAGGCLLTEKQFSLRLKDLLTHNPQATVRDTEFLKVGRQFRINARTKLICGRNQNENERLEKLARPEDVIVISREVPGPVAVLVGDTDRDMLLLAASVVVRYSDVPEDEPGRVEVQTQSGSEVIETRGATQETLDRLQVK